MPKNLGHVLGRSDYAKRRKKREWPYVKAAVKGEPALFTDLDIENTSWKVRA